MKESNIYLNLIDSLCSIGALWNISPNSDIVGFSMCQFRDRVPISAKRWLHKAHFSFAVKLDLIWENVSVSGSVSKCL